MKKYILTIIILGLIAVAGYLYFNDAGGGDGFRVGAVEYYNYPGLRATTTDVAVDLIGTTNGTTTNGVYFSDGTATSSYPITIGHQADEAILAFYPTFASTTGAHAAISIWGSNSQDCDTASTTAGTLNNYTTSDIKWFDIGDHVAELAGSQTLTGTSTISWNPSARIGKDIVLKDLNYECLKVEVNASSTIMQASIITKTVNRF